MSLHGRSFFTRSLCPRFLEGRCSIPIVMVSARSIRSLLVRGEPCAPPAFRPCPLAQERQHCPFVGTQRRHGAIACTSCWFDSRSLFSKGRGVVPIEVGGERGGSPFHGYCLWVLRCTHAHHARFVSALASPAALKASRSTLTLASSAPSHVGRCSSHQQTVRISRSGSRSGSQPGQYDQARLGVSTSSLLIGASAPGRPDRAVSARRAHERAERKPHRLDAREAVAV